MMKLVTLFLMFASTSASYTVKQIPMMIVPEFTCYDILKSKVKMDYLPIGVTYKGKQVFSYYCKNTLTGKFIQ